MQNHNAQKSIHASFKWYEKEVTGLFLSAKSVVQYSFFFYFSYCINVIYLGYSSKMKEIMNVNSRIILV